jgi:hypothetical protein
MGYINAKMQNEILSYKLFENEDLVLLVFYSRRIGILKSLLHHLL